MLWSRRTESKTCKIEGKKVSIMIILVIPFFDIYSKMHSHTCIRSRTQIKNSSVQFSTVTQSCLTLWDPMNRSMPGLPVHHQLPEFAQILINPAIQPPHPLSSPSPPAPNPSQHQGLFKWVSSSHQVAKILEFQLQHQSFQWTPRTDLL